MNNINNLIKLNDNFNYKCKLLKYSELIDVSKFLDIEKITNYTIEFFTTEVKKYLISNIKDLKIKLKNNNIDENDDSLKNKLIDNINLLTKIKDVPNKTNNKLTFKIPINNEIFTLNITFNILSKITHNEAIEFATFQPNQQIHGGEIIIKFLNKINNIEEYNWEIFNLKNSINHECLHFIQFFTGIGYPSKLKTTYLHSNTNEDLPYHELDVEFYPILYDKISEFNHFFGNIPSKKIKSEIALIFVNALKPMKYHSVYNSVYRDVIKVSPFFKDLYNNNRERWQKACKIFLLEVLK